MKYIPCRKRQIGVLELEAYYNPTRTFHSFLTVHLGGGNDIEDYIYTAKEKRRIFRRRPPEWIARWKRLYIKKLKLKLAIRARRSRERYTAILYTESKKRDYFLDRIKKNNKAWKGNRYVSQFKQKE